ncbi:MAG: helix-turn-helix transcriptional regulator [Pseudomonadota bacterium]
MTLEIDHAKNSPATDSNAIYRLWDELSAFAVGDADAALEHLLGALCSMFGAHNALWSKVVRLPSPAVGDPLGGWRPRLVRVLKPVTSITGSIQEQVSTSWSPAVDLSQIQAVSGPEQFRVRLLFEALPREWFDGPHYRRHYLDVGHADSMSMRCAVNDDVRVHIFLFRSVAAERFQPSDKEPFALALRALRWFYRQQLLSQGLLIANAPLTAMERRVLLQLLDGKTEKEIAALLEQSPHTTHVHVKSIYDKFDVHNRSTLMSLWLGRLPGTAGHP